MHFFRQWGRFMMMGARAHAQWELHTSQTIIRSRNRCFILGLLLIPIIIGGFALLGGGGLLAGLASKKKKKGEKK